MKSQTKSVNFLMQAAALTRLERTGWQILGGHRESVAAHSYMVAVIAHTIACILHADRGRVALIALFHDLPEVRTGDVYKLADLYVQADDRKAAKDTFQSAPDADSLMAVFDEYEEEKTLESKIVHDADTLALCVELKQMMEEGNTMAENWFSGNKKALRLETSREIFDTLAKTNSQEWWEKERQEIHKGFGSKKV
jgi:putative hydrolases of HD superfamily